MYTSKTEGQRPSARLAGPRAPSLFQGFFSRVCFRSEDLSQDALAWAKLMTRSSKMCSQNRPWPSSPGSRLVADGQLCPCLAASSDGHAPYTSSQGPGCRRLGPRKQTLRGAGVQGVHCHLGVRKGGASGEKGQAPQTAPQWPRWRPLPTLISHWSGSPGTELEGSLGAGRVADSLPGGRRGRVRPAGGRGPSLGPSRGPCSLPRVFPAQLAEVAKYLGAENSARTLKLSDV